LVELDSVQLVGQEYEWHKTGQHMFMGDAIINGRKILVDLFFTTRSHYACALMHHTGPKSYNIRVRKVAKDKGYKLNQYDLMKHKQKVKVKTEKDICRKLHIHYYVPSLRS
jgi:DNA polymerase (family 10)